MAVDTVNLVVKVPGSLRKRARAVAVLRGETISDVVRTALADYITRAESEADDVRYVDAVLTRIAEGAPTYSHEAVWAEIDRLEIADALLNQSGNQRPTNITTPLIESTTSLLAKDAAQ